MTPREFEGEGYEICSHQQWIQDLQVWYGSELHICNGRRQEYHPGCLDGLMLLGCNYTSQS